MSKETLKKLGNPKLDRKKSLKIPPARNEEEEDINTEYICLEKLKTLQDLMDHFGIDSKGEYAWQELSFELAETYVPAMQLTERKGQPKIWNFFSHSALYALVKVTQKKYPDISKKEIFNKIPEEAQHTSLSVIIKPDANPATLEGTHGHFAASSRRKTLESYIDCLSVDYDTALQFFLSDEYKHMIERLIEKPDHEEMLFINFILTKIAKK